MGREQLHSGCILIALFFMPAFGEDAVPPKVFHSTPQDGSTRGATMVYIFGQGFSSSANFNSDPSQAHIGNKVNFVSDRETTVCDVDLDATHETMIACRTRPMKNGHRYFIEVEVDGEMAPYAYSYKPRFYPRWWRTPYIRTCGVEPTHGNLALQTSQPPGGLITVSGRIFTAIYGSNNQTNEGGTTASFSRVYFGGHTCDLLKSPDVFYDLRLTNEWGEGTFTCRTKGTFVGYQNISFILTENYGRSESANTIMRVSSTDVVYNFQTYAEITRVTPELASTEGGTRIVIEGRNFDNTTKPVEVIVGGIPCSVIEDTLTSERVECITGKPGDAKEFYTGSRGILMHVWNESIIDNDEVLAVETNASNYEGVSWLESPAFYWNDSKDIFVAELIGVFVAQRTDRYKFAIRSDDQSSLYLNCNRSKENLTKVAKTLRATWNNYRPEQVSEWMYLEKGQQCYLVTTFREYYWRAHMSIGVHRATTTLTNAQSDNAKNEIQLIDFSAEQSNEKQNINFTDWDPQTGVAEVQEITVEHSCIGAGACDGVGYRLGFEGVKTLFIKADASASTVSNALQNIFALSDADIRVTSTESTTGRNKYDVEFRNKIGDYPSLRYEEVPSAASGDLSVSVDEKTKGVSERRAFKLLVAARSTTAIPEDADENVIHDALTETMSAYCPSFLLPDIRLSSVVTTRDYETEVYGEESGDRIEDVEPFCGKKSLMNPEYVYYAGKTADYQIYHHSSFDATSNNWLCFAHRGLMYEYMEIGGAFRGAGRDEISGNYEFAHSLVMEETDWRYSCLDLMEVIVSHDDFAHVDDVEISIIKFFRKGPSYDFFVDALTIGNSKVTEDVDGVVGVRTPPALANGEPISGFMVERPYVGQQSFDIEVETYNCGYLIPLIKLAHTAVSSTNADTQNQRESSWDPDTKFITTRLRSAVAPMTGSFDLTVNLTENESYLISAIPVDISSEELENRLENEAPGFGQAKVTLSGSCYKRDYKIEWISNGGDKPQMQVHTEGISGADDLESMVTTIQDGGVFHDPIDGNMLRIPYDQPQVELYINGITSKCSGSCQLATSEAQTPVISGFSPSSGSSYVATSITIAGTNLIGVTGFSTTVMIGETECVVTSQIDTEIICTLGKGPLGTYDLILSVGGKGYPKKETDTVSLEFTIMGGVSSIDPATAFNTGGTNVNITGYGFTSNTVFDFAGKLCAVQTLTPTSVTCITPEASPGETDITISVRDGSETLGTLDFQYVPPTSVITSVSPTTSTSNGGGNFTISGTGLGASNEDVQVLLGDDRECTVLEWSPTQIICRFSDAPPARYAVNVIIGGSGYADTSTNSIPEISYILEVTDVSPLTGSMQGGTLVTIAGDGFTDEETLEVLFGESSCDIQSISSTSIECVIEPLATNHVITNGGTHPTEGSGFAWEPLSLRIRVGDTVTWRWNIDGSDDSGLGAMVFTTATSTSNEYDDVTFRSSTVKTKSGPFSYTFSEEGTYYISSGNVDEDVWGTITMRGTVIVLPTEVSRHQLSMEVSGHEAVYSKTSRKKRDTSCPGAVVSVPGCTPTAVADDPTTFGFASGECFTPVITSISPTQGTMDQTITIRGRGFGTDDCANKVIIAAGYGDEYTCVIISSTSETIKCKPHPLPATRINVAFHVKINVDSMGDTISMIKRDADRRFTLLPSVKTFTPKSGSVSGGTLINITGSGFSSATNEMSVTVGGYSCDIQKTSYYFIECLTPLSASESTKEVVVTVKGQAAECTGNCEFSYRADLTPVVTLLHPSTVNSSNTEITFEGRNFIGSESKVHVMLGEHECQVTSSTSTKILCTIEALPAGSHAVELVIDGKGRAELESVPTSIQSPAVVTSMFPVNGSRAGGTVIKFNGNGFAVEDLQVTIHNVICPVIQETATNFQFECVTPAKGGLRTITVTGRDQTFSSNSPLNFHFRTDLTPTLIGISPSEGETGDTVTLDGTLLNPDDMIINIGESACNITGGSQTSVTCTLGDHAGGTFPVSASVGILGFAVSDLTFNYTFDVIAVSPIKGSFGGGDLLTLSGKGFGSDTEVYVCDSPCLYGDEFPGTSAERTQIVCLLTKDTSSTFGDDRLCDITAIVDGQIAIGKDLYTFSADQTPIVTGVSPSRGGTQGGTNITITGTLFDPDETLVSVTIGGVSCIVSSSTETEIQCTTEARGKSLKARIEVTVTGKGIAANNDVDFYYVDVWSSRWTWGGLDPPVLGDFVVVPADQTIVLDVDTPVLKMLLIQGGTVIFEEKDLHLETENILITDGGVLQIGSEEDPFQHKAVITLHGHLRSPELPIYGAKTIGIRNGSLELHGMHLPVTWTHLEATAFAGSKVLQLKQPVTWQYGDEIVVATTGGRHSQVETEEAVIESVSDDGMTLTLVDPLEYDHISAIENFDGVTLETRAEVGLLTRNIVIEGSKNTDWSVPIPACEAGFDTGEFKTQTCFQGRFGEEEGSDEFGAQIMVHQRTPGIGIAHARLEYVELRHMGQAFRLGRYPIHFHLMGDVQFKSYVRGCAIHNTFNRAVTIHNTHHLLVEHNVVYDVMGGAVFIEDGIEHGNMIQYNLVLFVKQSTSLQNDDITPAAFWVTNPNNTIQHNAAAGGTHFGFWYRIHEHPDGPSYDSNICQQLHPVEIFQNNTVHSQGWFGLWVFETYTPRGDGSCGSTSPTVAEFHSLRVWHCEKGAEVVNGGAIKLIDAVMACNEKAGIETKLIVDENVEFGQTGTYNSYIIAQANQCSEDHTTKKGLILPFSEGYEVINVTFVNFDRQGSSGIGVTTIDGTCTVLCGGWESRFEKISFLNSPNKGAWRWEHEGVLRDIDGTLTGTLVPSVVVPYDGTVSLADCTYNDGWSNSTVPGVVCDGSVKFHRVSWNNVLPTSLEAKDVIFTTDEGSSAIKFAKKRLTHKFGWMVQLEDGKTYMWQFEHAEQITNISYSATFYTFMEDDCVVISHNFTQKADKVIITEENTDAESETMVSCTDNYHGDYFVDPDTNMLFYIVSGRDRNGTSSQDSSSHSAMPGAIHRTVNFRVYQCFYEGCITPVNPNNLPPVTQRPAVYVVWHPRDGETPWSVNDDGEVVADMNRIGFPTPPTDDQDIRIAKGTWMVVDQEFPIINKLWIGGVLELEGDDANLDFTLSATHIIIMGGRLIVGWPDSSFKGSASIILRGDINTPEILLNGGVNIGSKAIGVVGGIDLHGRRRDPPTTHLASTLNAGDNTITLEDTPTDWAAGDDLAIAATGQDPWETETFRIVAVSGNTITLNDTARYDHIARAFAYSDVSGTEVEYDIRAEVSILTRNIKIIGEDTGDIYDHSFGARVLIAGIADLKGYARIHNTEFYHSGQEGFIDNFDPRYSLAFLNTGDVNEVKPSSVKENSFHNGFNTAIGVFGATGLVVDANVIHHTVGPGIRVEGTNVSLLNNLVMLARTRSVYQDRFEVDIMLWKAAIEVNHATSPMLSGNVVAGSERAGYRINGHDCASMDTNEDWGYNTARATLHGVFMNEDGYSACTAISKFIINFAYDCGVYYQGTGSLKVDDFLVTDSNFGFVTIIDGPPATSHLYQDKYVLIENSAVVAISMPGYCPILDPNTDFVLNSQLARPARRTGSNAKTKVGILFAAFISSHNSAPSKPFASSLDYSAIGGRMDVRDSTFVNFGDTSCSNDHAVFMTNLQVEDFLHPVATEGLNFINTPGRSRLFYHRPSLGKINPSDCVDMECDGMKKALLTDRDGSLLGTPGTVIPQAEFEWNGDPKRGLGDYRIPKTLLTYSNGSKIDIEDIAPNKGILRANTSDTSCTYNDAWQAYECHGYNHTILNIESMDADTETRRLSPVALLAEGYIDLNNGPQDHGWCSGYTCQERLSTFWTIVAPGKVYEMHFSSTAPQKLRLRLLNEGPDKKLVIKILYLRPQRLDVYANNRHVVPPNADISDGNYRLLPPDPTDPDGYKPSLDSNLGANYHDIDAKMLYITLNGESYVDIVEAEVVIISFGLPATTPDEFFDGGQLVANLAAFLKIPISKIRIVSVIREGSARRRRRAIGDLKVNIEIGNEPSATLNTDTSDNNTTIATTTAAPNVTSGTTPTPTVTLSLEDVQVLAAEVTTAFQQDTISDAIGTEVTGLTVADARTPPVHNPNNTSGNDTETVEPVQYFVPAGLRILQQPSTGYALSSLVPEIQVTGIDVSGDDIVLGHKGNKWQAIATIYDGPGELMGNTTVAFDDGIAAFEDLTASVEGTYILSITVTYPANMEHLNATTQAFILDRPLTTAPPAITTPPPLDNGTIGDCPLIWNTSSSAEKMAAWICVVRNWRSQMHKWVEEFEEWRVTCMSDNAGPMEDIDCPDENIFGCCTGTRECEEDSTGCSLCHCAGGKYGDSRQIRTFWRQQKDFYINVMKKYQMVTDQCTSRVMSDECDGDAATSHIGQERE